VDPSDGDIDGELPSAITPPDGCRFNTRCQHATDICFTDEPQMQQIGDEDHYFACHHPVEVLVGL
jgi:peptide/nickel transport system ATP-binding protein